MSEGRPSPNRDSSIPTPDTRVPATSIDFSYLETDALGAPRVRDTLDILVPIGGANLFVTFHDDQGRERTGLVRAPLLCVMPPGLPHALTGQEGSLTLVMAISGALFAEAALAALRGAEPTLRAPHAADDPLLRQIGDAVEADVRGQRPFDPGYLESLAAVLAMHVARHYVATEPEGGFNGGLAPYKLQRVREFIAEHLSEPISVERLARVAYLSPFHFARMFKQSTGQSPHLHVLMQRLERARELLADTETSLVEVAAEVGFRTQGHFTAVFHRYSGCTPRVFRLNSHAAAASKSAGTGSGLAGAEPPAPSAR